MKTWTVQYKENNREDGRMVRETFDTVKEAVDVVRLLAEAEFEKITIKFIEK